MKLPKIILSVFLFALAALSLSFIIFYNYNPSMLSFIDNIISIDSVYNYIAIPFAYFSTFALLSILISFKIHFNKMITTSLNTVGLLILIAYCALLVAHFLNISNLDILKTTTKFFEDYSIIHALSGFCIFVGFYTPTRYYSNRRLSRKA